MTFSEEINDRNIEVAVAERFARRCDVCGEDFRLPTELVTDEVLRVATFPDHTHPLIEYAAVVNSHADRDTVDAYFAFLMSADAQARFAAHGFLPASGP